MLEVSEMIASRMQAGGGQSKQVRYQQIFLPRQTCFWYDAQCRFKRTRPWLFTVHLKVIKEKNFSLYGISPSTPIPIANLINVSVFRWHVDVITNSSCNSQLQILLQLCWILRNVRTCMWFGNHLAISGLLNWQSRTNICAKTLGSATRIMIVCALLTSSNLL